ncbi:alpha-(1,3)-fucosyltransferase C-like [Ruditapes philippinarum]|uniref:alpha-(1,3)-fucosyltransferase C-like n=1 Tax=Ruditapes philippinarum TaxID=129788 RepID=UPI00295B01B0|nr:alpha-(1,3)-fucosyltransferase C-like [Ruditapes philippinarum]
MNKQIRRLSLGILLIHIGLFASIFYHWYIKHECKKNENSIHIKNTLVDIPDIESNFKKAFPVNTVFRILFINKPLYIHIKSGNNYIQKNCYFKNCVLIDETKSFSQMSAIVFNAQDELHFNGSFLRNERQSLQIWISFREEPIGNVRTTWFRDNVWKNAMNWTWGYRLDSDIFFPYQTLATRKTQLKRDYTTVFKGKTKLAAWIVSHCHAKSLRDEYVQALIKEGIDVDIFGKCSQNRTRVNRNHIHKQINTDYKFYFSFENNFCKDYVSEKFFDFFSLDTILIVRGGFNYSKHFDNNAFIDASLFPTVKSLAKYILRVGNDMNLYTKYLQAKDKYEVEGTSYHSRLESMCKLCEHMNNQNRYKKTYKDIASYLENGTCFNPEKIE